MITMGKGFTDKVTEYRILNEQLMTKALALLKTADDLMIDTESEADEKTLAKPNKYCKDLENSLSELSKSFENLKTPKESYLSTDTDNLNEKSFENKAFDDFMKTKNKIKNKFYFPKHVVNEGSFLEFNDELDTSLDEQENGDINGIENMFRHQKESDTIMKNFMNTKSALQSNSRSQKEAENGDQPSKITDQCVKVLKYKIESLENEMRTNQENLKKKTAECDKFSKENQSLAEGKTKLNAQINAIKSQMIKKDEKIFNLSTKIQAMENELRTTKSEHEMLSKTAKEAVQDVANIENKFAKAMKEIAALKETLNTCKIQEKEQKDAHRKQIDELTAFMKAAEKKEKAYEAAMKKQTFLVDNLKKQISYMSMSNNLDETEKQLDSILKLEVSKK